MKKLIVQISNKMEKAFQEAGYDEKYGARPLRRTIQNELEIYLKIAKQVNIKLGFISVHYRKEKLHFIGGGH